MIHIAKIMIKKILLSIGYIFFISLSITYSHADDKNLLPLKKPLLSEKEIKKKISVNILKPLPKPVEKVLDSKIEKKVDNQELKQKTSFLIPKKKPIVAGIKQKNKTVSSKFYSKRDFDIAK